MNIRSEIQTKDGYTQAKIWVHTDNGADGIVMVGEDGWNFSRFDLRDPDRWGQSSRGKNIRISSNQPMFFTLEEFDELKSVIHQQIEKLGI